MRRKPVILGVKLLTNAEVRELLAAARFRKRQWKKEGEWIHRDSDCKLCGKYNHDVDVRCREEGCPAEVVKVVNLAIVDKDTQESDIGFTCVAVCGEYYLREEEDVPELVDTLIDRCEMELVERKEDELLERKAKRIGAEFSKLSDSEKRALLMGSEKETGVVKNAE